MKTIKDVIDIISSEGGNDRAFGLHFGNFLEYFYFKAKNSEERLYLVEEEPTFHSNITKKDYAFIAGAVQKICKDYDVKRPDWVMKKRYFLEEPYFGMNAKGNLRLVLLAESPPEFRVRQIFTSANTLDRV